MTPAQALFLDALDQPEALRDAFLAARAGHDGALLAEARALLVAHHAEGLLGAWQDDVRTTGLPERVGDWRIIRLIGEGGMGVVALAERATPGFQQRAAIKLVRGRVRDGRLAARLARERDILARLEHPGIARLIDGGIAGGQPWFAMEYVEGVSLLDHVSRAALPPEDRLTLFLQVCDAVRHAHQQLVVHRDLKPANILVDAHGRVRLLDFGIATVLEPTAPLPGAEVATLPWFTPAYASPEQVRGERITTLSDVHALGVVLYELLTGVRPLDVGGASPAEVVRVVTRVEPIPPSERVCDARLARQLAGDLDQICRTAMAKDPAQRYPSVTALMEDLQRHLAGRPILARPDAWGYRAAKFVGRHKVAVVSTAMVFGSLVGGIVATSTYARRAAHERDLAAAQAAKAAQVSGLLVDLFRVSDPAHSGGAEVTAREVLDRGADRIGRELLHQPDLQAALLREVAQVYANLGVLDRAEILADRALVLDTLRLGGGSPDNAANHALLGRIYASQGRRSLATQHLERALVLHPRVDTTHAHLAVDLAWQRRDAGDTVAARMFFAQAAATLRAAGATHSPSATAALLGLATLEHDAGRFDDATRQFEEALATVDTARGRPHPSAATALLEVGRVRRIREQFLDAAPLLERAVTMRATLYEPGHPLRLEADGEWAKVLLELGRLTEARAVLAGALPRAMEALGRQSPRTVMLFEALAMVDLRSGRAHAAAARLDSVLDLKRRIWPGDHPEVTITLIRSGDALLAANHPSAALARFRAGRTMAERTAGTESVYRMLGLWGEARVAILNGEAATARAALDTAEELANRLLRPGHRWRVAIESLVVSR